MIAQGVYNNGVSRPEMQHSDAPAQGGTTAAGFAVLPDEKLLARIVARDEAALAALYERYIRLIYALALRITGDRLTAEEVVQDVFQNVWQSAGSYRVNAGTVSSWLLGITRHRAIDATRSKRERARAREETLDPGAPLAASLPVEQEVAQRLEREAMRQALDELPSSQRQAIEMAYYGGLSGSEIAAALGEPLGTVKTRLRLGLLKLRDLLRPPDQGMDRP
jgi:RNA polymerase sigma-70 factor (ECF subfamily)